MQAYASIVGLHRSVLSAIPLFVVYLATLVHVYALSRQQVQSATTANAPSTANLGQDLESGRSSAHSNAAPSPVEADSMFSRGRQGLFQGWQAFKGFLLAVCSARERPLHFVKVEFAGPQGWSDLFSSLERLDNAACMCAVSAEQAWMGPDCHWHMSHAHAVGWMQYCSVSAPCCLVKPFSRFACTIVMVLLSSTSSTSPPYLHLHSACRQPDLPCIKGRSCSQAQGVCAGYTG